MRCLLILTAALAVAAGHGSFAAAKTPRQKGKTLKARKPKVEKRDVPPSARYVVNRKLNDVVRIRLKAAIAPKANTAAKKPATAANSRKPVADNRAPIGPRAEKNSANSVAKTLARRVRSTLRTPRNDQDRELHRRFENLIVAAITSAGARDVRLLSKMMRDPRLTIEKEIREYGFAVQIASNGRRVEFYRNRLSILDR